MLFIGQAGPGALQSLIQTDLILFVAWLVGDAARIRRLYTDNLVEQARLVDREREERTRRAVLEERERIARELHDVVAHHVSVMVIQAGGGLSAIATRPGDARSALESIATTGRLALTDMRRMLGVLGAAETQEPMPGLDRLDDLWHRFVWPDCPWSCRWRASGDASTRASSCPRTALSRKRSPTHSSTRRAGAHRWS